MNKQKTSSFLSKPDEMQMAISYQAMRLTWIIINVVFVVMAVYFFITNGQNPVSLLLLLVAEVIYFLIKTVLRVRMTKGGKDNE